MSVNEPCLFQYKLCRRKVRPIQQHMRVRSISDRSLINRRYPQRHRIAPATAYGIPTFSNAAVARNNRSRTFSTALTTLSNENDPDADSISKMIPHLPLQLFHVEQ